MIIQLIKTFDNIPSDTHTENVGRTSAVYLTEKLKYVVRKSMDEQQVGEDIEFDTQVDAETDAARWVDEEFK